MRGKLLHAFARSQRGVSAVEFALVLPIMMTLYFGAYELGTALTLNRKVSHVTGALADLVTQSNTLSNSDITNIMDAAESIIAPYDQSKLRIKLTEVKIDATTGIAKAVWSDARHDTAYAVGAVVPIPPAIATKNTHLVTAEVHYAYTPLIGYIMTGSFDLKNNFYLRPRLKDCVKRTGSTNYACPP